ncbi:hypothetical protein ACQPYK_49930 (plasmid) [Streptosporangium sp. CA-135522]|uniref:hypothetical protein n=1 Tax=Streptosporangium sp. CA-135522 TaxID=3240072 RepID=UPI003D931BAA
MDETWLAERGVTEWTEVPLWRTLPTAWAMSTHKAEAAGLVCRPLRETVADTWTWLRSGATAVAHERVAEHGLSKAREADLLQQWISRADP